MGDRISISFRQGERESVSLFSHWGGLAFLEEARDYASQLIEEREGMIKLLDRLDPETVMVDFIRHLTRKLKRVESNFYLGRNQVDGDNFDKGHHVIDLPIKSPF